ncbi:NifU family protein [Mycolicibacterium litorale]|uniref:NifU family protein n=1 Tax=Mycolicibacterium litorale TaxID=758802 RepID=UPI003CE9AE49
MTGPMLHPERTTDPRVMRWVTGRQDLPADCPQLTALVGDGTLLGFEVAPGEVCTTLAGDRSWSTDGPRVRSALFEALSSPGRDERCEPDELRRRIDEIVEHEVAPLARAHGGAVTVESVDDGVLTVDFGGACSGCSLRGRTLTNLVARAVQTRCPQIREVRAAQGRRAWLRRTRGGGSS